MGVRQALPSHLISVDHRLSCRALQSGCLLLCRPPTIDLLLQALEGAGEVNSGDPPPSTQPQVSPCPRDACCPLCGEFKLLCCASCHSLISQVGLLQGAGSAVPDGGAKEAAAPPDAAQGGTSAPTPTPAAAARASGGTGTPVQQPKVSGVSPFCAPA